MNEIRPYLVVIALMILSGCSSSDDGPSGPQVSNNLLGEWIMQLIDNGDGAGAPLCSEKLYYKFNSDNTYERKDFSLNEQNDNCVEASTINGSWNALSEQSIELIPNSTNFDEEIIEFEFEGDNLKIIRSSTTEEFYERPQ